MFARAAFLLVIAAICFASLAPSGWMPRVLYSYHLEHFAAFYLVALSMAAARYRANVYRVMADIAVLATVLEGVRLFHRQPLSNQRCRVLYRRRLRAPPSLKNTVPLWVR